MLGSPVLLSAFSVRLNSLNVKGPGWVYLFCIISLSFIIIKEHFICTYFYFLLLFLTYADVYVAINLHLINS